jgi:hypothetical protein
MSAVSITTINVLDNPAPFSNPLQFEIHYECLTDLEHGMLASSSQQLRRTSFVRQRPFGFLSDWNLYKDHAHNC